MSGDPIDQGAAKPALEHNSAGSVTPEARAYFEARVREFDGHWIWTGKTQHAGTPTMQMRGAVHLSPRRVSWALHRPSEPIPWHVTFTCSQPRCVHPDHLGPIPRKHTGAAR